MKRVHASEESTDSQDTDINITLYDKTSNKIKLYMQEKNYTRAVKKANKYVHQHVSLYEKKFKKDNKDNLLETLKYEKNRLLESHNSIKNLTNVEIIENRENRKYIREFILLCRRINKYNENDFIRINKIIKNKKDRLKNHDRTLIWEGMLRTETLNNMSKDACVKHEYIENK
jgi:hypothetical protein